MTKVTFIRVGDIVENFGQIVMVIRQDDERGLLVRDPGPDGAQWYADPAKCAVIFKKNRAIIAAWPNLNPADYADAWHFKTALAFL